MRTAYRRALYAAVILAITSSTSLHASAQSDDAKRSAARGFANDGLKALNDGKFPEALDLFGRAEALVHAPPHLLYMARANEKLGKLVQAQELYVKITREELPKNAPKAFADALKSAATEAAALTPRIPTLTIVVKGEKASEANVELDGAALDKALIGVAAPINPGSHKLRATTPTSKSKEVPVEIAEGAKETTTLELEASTDIAPPPETTLVPEQPKKRGTRIAPWIAFGVAVAGAGAGTFFLLQNRSKRDEADGLCANNVCPAARRSEIQSLDDEADSASTMSLVGYGVAGAAAATGVVLLLTSGSKEKEPPKTATTFIPWIGLASAGLRGSF